MLVYYTCIVLVAEQSILGFVKTAIGMEFPLFLFNIYNFLFFIYPQLFYFFNAVDTFVQMYMYLCSAA